MKNIFIVFTVFIFGIGVGFAAKPTPYKQTTLEGNVIEYETIASTEYWDILTGKGLSGRDIALGQNGFVKVVILDDGHTLYVLTYKKDKLLWEGRLVDLGNDGTVEIANISGKQCEQDKDAT